MFFARLFVYLVKNHINTLGCKQHSFVKLKFQLSQATLFRVATVNNQSKFCVSRSFVIIFD